MPDKRTHSLSVGRPVVHFVRALALGGLLVGAALRSVACTDNSGNGNFVPPVVTGTGGADSGSGGSGGGTGGDSGSGGGTGGDNTGGTGGARAEPAARNGRRDWDRRRGRRNRRRRGWPWRHDRKRRRGRWRQPAAQTGGGQAARQQAEPAARQVELAAQQAATAARPEPAARSATTRDSVYLSVTAGARAARSCRRACHFPASQRPRRRTPRRRQTWPARGTCPPPRSCRRACP